VCYKLLERLALQRISPTVEGLLSPDQERHAANVLQLGTTCSQRAPILQKRVSHYNWLRTLLEWRSI